MGYSQAIQKKNVIIDFYYGFPNLGKEILKNMDQTNQNIQTSAFKGIGPTGVRLEYMIAENFGLGFDFIYSSITTDFSVDSLNNDNTVYRTYNVHGYMNRFRFHVRANYHFVQDDSFDAYVGFGAGTNMRTIGFDTDYPNYERTKVTSALFPFSARIAIGSRYYFTNNFGLNLELGLGGPVLSAGVSLKF